MNIQNTVNFGQRGSWTLKPQVNAAVPRNIIEAVLKNCSYILQKLDKTPSIQQLFCDTPSEQYKDAFIHQLIIVFWKKLRYDGQEDCKVKLTILPKALPC